MWHACGVRRIVVGLVMVMLAGCVQEAEEAAPADPELVAIAEEICPLLWQWQLNVGAVMNDMSYDTRRTDEADDRLERYLSAFTVALQLNEQLSENILTLAGTGPFIDLMVQDVTDGVATANGIIEDLQTTVVDAHRAADPAYGEIVPVIFLDFEKVIDVAKPELAAYGSAELIDAFLTVPQCQHGVKDANDGVPRYVPLG